MKKEDLRIIFLGNPEFARFHLEKIIESGFKVVAVVSAADKPAGRGMKLHSTPVATYAKSNNIPLLQPKNLKSESFIEELKSFQADIQVVIAFRMLPEVVWDHPPMGTINIHASLLPQYRGAAPINWAIINGEKTTGVTSFKLKHQIDTGNILLQNECKITDSDTAGSLHDKLMVLGAETIVASLNGIIDGTLVETAQKEFDETNLKTAPKLYSENCEIDWNKDCKAIYNHIRGLSPYPVAHSYLDGKRLRIFSSEMDLNKPIEPAGTFVIDQNEGLKVACTNGYIIVKELQLEGKKRMYTEDFLRGYKTLDKDVT